MMISITFHIIQCIPQHLKHADIQRVTERFVEEINAWIGLKKKTKTKLTNANHYKDFI